MRPNRLQEKKTERLNLCITKAARERLEEIAEIEDRDLGYLAGFFLSWGIDQYNRIGGSLVTMKSITLVGEKNLRKQARARLVLREEARRKYEEEESAPERKRA